LEIDSIVVKIKRVEENVMNTSKNEVSRMSAAEEILNLADSISSYAEKLSGIVSDKMKPYVFQDPNTPEVDKPVREYPEYFNALRQRLWKIESQLTYINGLFERSEL
jgi:hypothetical protein